MEISKTELLKALKKISDSYFDKKDFISAGQINLAMDVVEDFEQEQINTVDDDDSLRKTN